MYYRIKAAASGSDLPGQKIVIRLFAFLMILGMLFGMLPLAHAEDLSGAVGSGAMPRTTSAEESSYWEPQYMDVAMGDGFANYLESTAGPISGLKLYGKNYNNESISLTICGKNLLKMRIATVSSRDFVWQGFPDGSISITGTVPSGVSSFSVLPEVMAFMDSIGSKYSIVVSGLPSDVSLAVYDSKWVGITLLNEKSNFLPNNTSKIINMYFQIRYAIKNSITFYPQIEVGSVATSYEPYRGKTIIIPISLYGFPVSSDGNYTDSSGQQWLSDVANFDDGVITRYCGYIEDYNGESITGPYLSSTGSLTNGAQVVYALDRPVTEPIPDDVLEQYHSLTFYDGVTNIIAEGCGIEVCKLLPTPDESLGSSLSDNFSQSVDDVTGTLNDLTSNERLSNIAGGDFIGFLRHGLSILITPDIVTFLVLWVIAAIIIGVYRQLKE